MSTYRTVLRPAVGAALWANGRVVVHEQIIDSLGRSYGLMRLVVDDVINVEPWLAYLGDVDIKGVAPACEGRGQVTIYYKFLEARQK